MDFESLLDRKPAAKPKATSTGTQQQGLQTSFEPNIYSTNDNEAGPIENQQRQAVGSAAPVPGQKRKRSFDNNSNDTSAAVMISCSCSKSKCLALYCSCFVSGGLCQPNCSCRGCCNSPHNTAVQNVLRHQAVVDLSKTDPLIFHRCRPPRPEPHIQQHGLADGSSGSHGLDNHRHPMMLPPLPPSKQRKRSPSSSHTTNGHQTSNSAKLQPPQIGSNGKRSPVVVNNQRKYPSQTPLEMELSRRRKFIEDIFGIMQNRLDAENGKQSNGSSKKFDRVHEAQADGLFSVVRQDVQGIVEKMTEAEEETALRVAIREAAKHLKSSSPKPAPSSSRRSRKPPDSLQNKWECRETLPELLPVHDTSMEAQRLTQKAAIMREASVRLRRMARELCIKRTGQAESNNTNSGQPKAE